MKHVYLLRRRDGTTDVYAVSEGVTVMVQDEEDGSIVDDVAGPMAPAEWPDRWDCPTPPYARLRQLEAQYQRRPR